MEAVGHLGDRQTPKTDDAAFLVAEDARPGGESFIDDRFVDSRVRRDVSRSGRGAIREQVPERNRDPSTVFVDVECRGLDGPRQSFNGDVGCHGIAPWFLRQWPWS